MDRRSLLRLLSGIGTLSLAGCLDALPSLGAETKLARLSVVNWDEDEAHTIDVRVERGGTVVHESTYRVEEMDGNEAQAAIAECTWNDVAGEYVIAARLDGNNEWQRFELLDAADGSPNCVIAAVQYGHLSGIDEDDPLNVEVRNRCDEVQQEYEGGCPAYTSNSSR